MSDCNNGYVNVLDDDDPGGNKLLDTDKGCVKKQISSTVKTPKILEMRTTKPTPNSLSLPAAAIDVSRNSALITGITGQDGSYLAELLLSKGYTVHGLVRRTSSPNTSRIDHLIKRQQQQQQAVQHQQQQTPPQQSSGYLVLHYGDITDTSCLVNLIKRVEPNEIYNLAAQSHVQVSFEVPEYTANVDALGTLRLLEAVRACGLEQSVRFYQASTSELFGKPLTLPQNEDTPFYPRSPYAVAKLHAYWTVINYREAYGMFACNGILFNHESPRRGEAFVTRKVTKGVASIALGRQEVLELGNLNARRDWGHARDYVEAMWRILQHNTAEDFVVGTGNSATVREFVELAFREVDRQIVWEGEGDNVVGKEAGTGVVRVRTSSAHQRPTDVETLVANASKAKVLLGWTPKVSLKELVKEMVASDIKQLSAGTQTHTMNS